MHLVDSNVWMQVLRNREFAEESRAFLSTIPPHQLFVTDFAICSIGIALQRYGQIDRFATFCEQSTIGTSIGILRLTPDDLRSIPVVCVRHNLDFDDAYQYVAAEKHDLTIVSFDAHFDPTPRGRRTPAQILASLTDEQ